MANFLNWANGLIYSQSFGHAYPHNKRTSLSNADNRNLLSNNATFPEYEDGSLQVASLLWMPARFSDNKSLCLQAFAERTFLEPCFTDDRRGVADARLASLCSSPSWPTL